MLTPGPLVATLSRIGAGDEWRTYSVGLPLGDGWVSLGEVITAPEIDRWLDRIRAAVACGHEDVAGSYLAAWVAGIVADTVCAAMRDERRAWPITLDRTFIHRHEQGWLDGLALRDPTVRVLAGDPDRDHPDAVVVDGIGILRDLVATEIVSTLATVFAAVRARVPFGLRGMWGSLADGIGSDAALAAVRRDIDVSGPWSEATAVIDAIAARAPLLRVRPRLREVEWSGGVAHGAVRGTCCLYYKTQVAPDRCGDGYCLTCPLRDPDDQLERWRSWLESTAQRAIGPEV